MKPEMMIAIFVCLVTGYLISQFLQSKSAKKIEEESNRVKKNLPERSFLIIPNKNEVSSFIELADKKSDNGAVNVNVVRKTDGVIALMSDYQRRVLSADIAELIYTTDEGFAFAKAA